jgi:hypothetical protein
MNAALLLMSTAFGAGDDVIQAGWGDRALPAMHRAGSCGSCGPTVASSCCDPCASSRTKLIDRLKALCAKPPSSGCDPCAGNPCNTGRYTQPNLLDNLRARRASKNTCCPSGCAPAYDPCATPPAPGAANPNPPNTLPQTMPPTRDAKGAEPKQGTTNAAPAGAAPNPVTLPALPSAPASAPKPRASGGRY